MNKLFLFAAGAALLTACGGKSENTEPVINDYSLNVSESSLIWTGYKKGVEEGQHAGTVLFTAGTVQTSDDNITSGSFTLDARSIATTDTDQMGEEYAGYLNADLHSENFFDVEKYPTFEVSVGELKDGVLPTTVKVKGVDFMQDVPVSVEISGESMTIHGEFTFDFEGITGKGFEEHDGKRQVPQVDFKLHLQLDKDSQE